MILAIDRPVATWEALAGLHVSQTIGAWDLRCAQNGDVSALIAAGGLCSPLHEGDWDDCSARLLNFGDAYRTAENRTDQRSYSGILAAESGLLTDGLEERLQESPLQFRQARTIPLRSIVVCPFPIKPELGLPLPLWKTIVKNLRSYDLPVTLMGEGEERMDACAFTETEILCWRSVDDRMAALNSAELVVGVPSAWVWVAAGLGRKICLFYPEKTPTRRWFPWADDKFGRILHDPSTLKVPPVLAAMRHLIDIL